MTYEEAKLDAFAALVPAVGECYAASFAGTDVEVTVRGFRPGGYVVCGITPKGEPEADGFVGKMTLVWKLRNEGKMTGRWMKTVTFGSGSVGFVMGGR